jgi:hypothetical protein
MTLIKTIRKTPGSLFLHGMAAAVLCTGLTFTLAHAQTAAKVTLVTGTLVETDAAGRSRVLAADSSVGRGTRMRTAADSYARLKFGDGTDLFLRPNTEVVIDEFRFEQERPANDGFVVSLLKGGFRTITGIIGKRNRAQVAYKTTTATIGIRGTHYGATLCADDCGDLKTESDKPAPNGLHIDVTEGTIVATTLAGEREFSAGQTAYARDAGSLPIEVPPADAIRTRIPENVFFSDTDGGQTVGVPHCKTCAAR